MLKINEINNSTKVVRKIFCFNASYSSRRIKNNEGATQVGFRKSSLSNLYILCDFAYILWIWNCLWEINSDSEYIKLDKVSLAIFMGIRPNLSLSTWYPDRTRQKQYFKSICNNGSIFFCACTQIHRGRNSRL